ncbi:hypothetical protein MATL_G00243840 [Megalops atlanticus]|uniref:E-selectin n=1 Tax=Megalops atlanticus TaxID=7932 RepID=A0A9D3PFB8_MEGAT|nr:hypothetical protein MATL_G00243840 [Megalops atlanticus]
MVSHDFNCGRQKIPSAVTMNCLMSLTCLYLIFAMLTEVHGFMYHCSDKDMMWGVARKWCQKKYTDLAGVQNLKDITNLKTLPPELTRCWIGLHKEEKVWTWVETKKELTEKESNWAPGEPNNMSSKEDCVEIYLNNGNNTGKLNDDHCLNRKRALCYKASCQPDSCSPNGECVETINNHTCKCLQGFSGKRCEYAVSCEEMDRPSHGLLSCTHRFGNFSYGSECKFSCEDGFQLVGSRSVQCTASGEWSAAPPSCEVVQCKELVSPGNGSMHCTHPLGRFSYTTVCEFSCEEGYRMTTNNTLLCGPTGQWTDSQPLCEAVRCPSVQAPQNGSVTCADSSGDLFYDSSEDLFYNSSGDLSYNSSCNFSCDPGFILRGSEVMTCGKSGDWIGECQAVRCPSVQAPQNGSVTCADSSGDVFYDSSEDLFYNSSGDLSYNSSCNFSCDPGFIRYGSEVMTCGKSGDWIGERPVCQAVRCPSVQAPQNGSVSCADFSGDLFYDSSEDLFYNSSGDLSYNSSCNFSCDPGFIRYGSEVMTCNKFGDWDEERPVCQAVQCRPLQAPEGGSVSCSSSSEDFLYGSRCSFSCADGHQLQGASSVTCKASAQWSAETPICKAVRCPSVQAPQNGSVTCADSGGNFLNDSSGDLLYDSSCGFSCDPGFILDGSEVVTCGKSGDWIEERPVCQVLFPTAHPYSTLTRTAVVVAFVCAASLLICFVVKRLQRRAKKYHVNRLQSPNGHEFIFVKSIPPTLKAMPGFPKWQSVS